MEEPTTQKKEMIAITESELRNILQGLDLLHTKLMNNMAAIHPLEANGPDLKKYYKEKQIELTNQMIAYNKILVR